MRKFEYMGHIIVADTSEEAAKKILSRMSRKAVTAVSADDIKSTLDKLAKEGQHFDNNGRGRIRYRSDKGNVTVAVDDQHDGTYAYIIKCELAHGEDLMLSGNFGSGKLSSNLKLLANFADHMDTAAEIYEELELD